MTARLDQLRFPDETKLGLALLVGYMLFDASQTYSLGGWHILKWLTGTAPSVQQAGGLQLFMLVTLSAILMGWRIRLSLKGLQLRRIEEVDAKASGETAYLGTRIARDRAKFFVTANMGDTNAFCMWAGRTPWIVLGGGLRLLFRKDPARARAIVGHECAHVDVGDTQYLLVAWHVFNSYALLTIGYLVLVQAQFWLRVPDVLPAFHRQGLGLPDLLKQNAVNVFRNGFPGLIALAGLAFTLRHFARLREYRADERAAQVGLRQPLIDTLNVLTLRTLQPRWRQLVMFHPTADERAKRLSNEAFWAKPDLLFIGTLAFLATRIDEHFEGIDEASLPDMITFDDMLTFLPSAMAAHPLTTVSVMLWIVFLFIAVVNVYRASATQAKFGVTLRSRLTVALSAFAALFLGSLLGDLTSLGQLMRLSDVSTSQIWIKVADSAFSIAALTAMAGTFLLLSVSLVSSRMLKHARPLGWSQLWTLSWWTLLAVFALQLVVNIVAGLVGLAIGGGMNGWEVSWLPRSSRQDISNFPSLLQAFACFLLAVVALQVFRLWPGRPVDARANIDASWLIQE
ncbi:M48 family metalloprotease [Variovorax sp. CY25R-8]|uniref:M48 family metalloprotease n=1 Tax=Variovorax sp. CY25R-8 TaxID=2855501 RepID=UPI0021BBB5CA|nr:M48 family metalloprotease [Variovorax sp. CY25R-8]MCT8178350.1 M48 family metalloprotease [Variovorax sp. CY25R-8]